MSHYLLPVCQPLFSEKADFPLSVSDTLPDYQPDIRKILSACGTACVSDMSCQNGSVTLSGTVSVRLLYLSENTGFLRAYVFPVEFAHTFDTSLDEETLNTAFAEKCVCVSGVSARQNGQRAVDVRMTVRLQLDLFSCGDKDMLSFADESITVRENTKDVARHTKLHASQSLREEIPLGEGMAPIADITELYGDLSVDSCDVRPDVLRYTGTLTVHAGYRAESDGAETADYLYLTKELPFSGEIAYEFGDTPVTSLGKGCLCYLEAGSSYDAYGENKLLTVSASFDCLFDCFSEETVSYAEDAYCPDYQSTPEYGTVTAEKLAGTFRETLNGECPVSIDASRFSLIHHSHFELCWYALDASDGRLFFAGKGSLTAGGTKNNELVSYTAPVTFRFPLESVHDIPADGKYLLAASVKSCDAYLRAGETVLALTLTVSGIGVERVRFPALEGFSVDYDAPKNACHSEFILYYPSLKETYWDIAKRYDVPLALFKETNHLSGECVTDETPLLIPCR